MKTIYVCLACGKRSNDVYGKDPIDYGWDVSCMLNSVEVYEDKIAVQDSRVTQIPEDAIVHSLESDK